MPTYDARSVANLLLDLAGKKDRQLSNLVLQKILYFVHGQYMNVAGEPLVLGTFEAWQYGPVHPHVYAAFKKYGDNPIAGRAERVDPVTFRSTPVARIQDDAVIQLVDRSLSILLERSPSDLVSMSHAKDAPWDFVVDRTKKRMSISLRITNEIIKERFKFHKLNVADMREKEVPNENSPFS